MSTTVGVAKATLRTVRLKIGSRWRKDVMGKWEVIVSRALRGSLLLFIGGHVSKRQGRLPGYGPAAEINLYRQKDPKPMTPSQADLMERTPEGERANSLRSNKARQI